MSDHWQEIHHQLGLDSGGNGGALYQRAKEERTDTRLFERAINERWGISKEIKELARNQMALIVGRSDHERNRIAASRVLVMMDNADGLADQNLLRARQKTKTLQELHQHQHVHLSDGAADTSRAEIRRIIDRLRDRKRAIETGGFTGDGGNGDGAA